MPPFREEQRYEYDLGPTSVVLDVGAFEGTFTREISRRYGCRVFAFEPVRRHFELVRALAAANVEVFDFAVGASDRTERIGVCGDGSSIFRSAGEVEEIEVRSLARVLDDLGLRHVDLLKLNVEGCEYEILEHALREGLAARFEHIQVQFHELAPDAAARRDAIRRELGRTHRASYDHPFMWEGFARVPARVPLAVAALFRDEARFLDEWIDYHRLVGVERFWLYDAGSADGSRAVLAPHVESGLVETIAWPVETDAHYMGRQVACHRDAVLRAVGRARWLALIDVDEFLVPLADETVAACLERRFARASAVYVNWRNFGTGGVHLARGGPILGRLTACSPRLHPRNSVGKSIVRPEQVRAEDLWYSHHATLAPGAAYHDGDGREIETDALEPALDGRVHDGLLRLNHYALRDEAYFRSVRLPRARRLGADEALLWEHHDAFSQEQDRAIVDLVGGHRARRWARHEEDWPRLGPFASARIYGGLGNNLFQIAAASALAWDNGAEPVFPELDPASERYARVFLRCNVGPDPGGWREWPEPSYAYSPIPFAPGIRLVGYFQSERYFAHHRARIEGLFAPSPSDAAHLRGAYGGLLERPDTVGVQLRYWRWEDGGGAMYPQYGRRYLKRALEHVPSSARFVLSSNNLEFARASLPKRMRRRLVVLEGEPDHIDLQLLSACRHLIITNSSFGWWAAWLGERADRVVVRPRGWVNGLPQDDVCPERWVAIDGADD